MAAAASDKIEVAAFIMMHAGIYLEGPVQIHPHASGKDSPAPYHYRLNASPVPHGINLYAPSILGYSYYDSLMSVDFLHEKNETYVSTQPRPPGQTYIDYWLEQIKSFEERHVAETTESLNSGAIPHGERDKRNLYSEIVTHKPRVNWKKHTHYITQKKYTIDADYRDKGEPPSSIIFCCQEDLLDKLVQQANSALQSEEFDGYKCVCAYDMPRRTFSIHFMAEQNIISIPFETILLIIQTVLRIVLPQGHNLSIFDFTCSDVDFLGLPQPLTPVFLSYNESENIMIYGTNPTESFHHHEYNKSHLLLAGPGDASPAPHRSQFKTDEGPSHSPSPADPTPLIYVQLDEHIRTFVDVNLKVEVGSNSISPPRQTPIQSNTKRNKTEDGRHGGRARNHKKTRRRRITRRRRNGRFRSKGSNRRTRK